MSGRPQVLVGVDTTGTRAVVELATAEAGLRGVPMRVLANGPVPGLPDARIVTGDLAEALIAESRDASLVVIGRSGGGSGSSTMDCQRLAAHAFCPVLVTPADPVVPTRDVLLGLDINAHDAAAIEFAFEEATLRRAPLIAVHVWAGVPPTALGAVDPFAYDVTQAHETVDRLLAEELAGYPDKYPNVRVTRLPVHDVNPANALLRASSGAGLIVVGASRERFYSGQLLGTVTRRLLNDAACPVGVVRLVG